jgi:Domain of unknown function (DUF4336)
MADRVTYPPLDVPKPFGDGLWIVDGAPIRPGGLSLPVRMTVIRLGSGELWLHSPVRHGEALARALAALGTVRHLVAPNIGHWSFLPDWQRAFPQATLWAAPGLRARRAVRKSGLRIDHDLGERAPAAWAGEIEQAVIPGAGGFREVAFLHLASRTLVLTDLIVNLEAGKLPLATRLFARLNGMLAPHGRAAAYVRLSVRLRRAEAARALSRLLDRNPERLVFAHGRPFERDGAAAARRSLAWLLG